MLPQDYLQSGPKMPSDVKGVRVDALPICTCNYAINPLPNIFIARINSKTSTLR